MAETLAQINFNDPAYAEGVRALQDYMRAMRAEDWETARLKIANVFYALGGTSARAQRPTDEDLLYEYQKMKNMKEMIENTVDMYQIASTSERMADQQYNDATTSLFTSYMNNIQSLLSNQLSGQNTAALERAKAEVTADQGARDKAYDAYYKDLEGMEQRVLTESELAEVTTRVAEKVAEAASASARRTGDADDKGTISREDLATIIHTSMPRDTLYRNSQSAQVYGYLQDEGLRRTLGIEPRLQVGDAGLEERALARLSGWNGQGNAGDHLRQQEGAANTVTLVNAGKRLAEAQRYDDRLYGDPETGLTRDGGTSSTRRFFGTYLNDKSANAAHKSVSKWVLTSKDPNSTEESRTSSFEEMRDELLGGPTTHDQTTDLLDQYTTQVDELNDLGLPTLLSKKAEWEESDLGKEVKGTREAGELGMDVVTRQVGKEFMPGVLERGRTKRGVRQDVRESLAAPQEEPEVEEVEEVEQGEGPDLSEGVADRDVGEVESEESVSGENLLLDQDIDSLLVPEDEMTAEEHSAFQASRGYPYGSEEHRRFLKEIVRKPDEPPIAEPEGGFGIDMDSPLGQGAAPERGPEGPGAPPEALPPKSLRAQVDGGARDIIRQRIAGAPPSEEPEEVAEEAPTAPPGFAPEIAGLPEIFPFARRRREQKELEQS